MEEAGQRVRPFAFYQMPSKPRVFRPSHLRRASIKAAETYEQDRGSARQRGYTPAWDAASAGFRLAHQFCLGCEAVGWVRLTAVTDHVIPHRGDRALFWDRSLWQPACTPHHNVVKQTLEEMYDRGEIDVDQLWLDSETAKRLTLELMAP